jgi:hypothetical protein
MNTKKLSQITFIFIVIMLLMVGCGGQKHALKCNITTEEFGFEITGEDETVTQTSNNESKETLYDPSGQMTSITVKVNRDLVFEKSKHTYHIEGIIKLDPLTDELTYDITATGDTFGKSPQTCKKP